MRGDLKYPGSSALRQFLDRKHRIEHFDGKVPIYLHDPEDVPLLASIFLY